MGMSASATICYGKAFEEGYEFPWGDDIESWWRKELGFKHKKEIWKNDGSEYIDGTTEEEADFYYKEIRDFDKQNPCPVTIIHCGSDDYYSEIIAAPKPMIHASWEKPEVFDPEKAFYIPSDTLHKYYEFMNKYFKDEFDGAKWLVACSWG